MAKYTAKQIIDALQKSKGIKSKAAEALQCSRNTIDKWIRDYPTVADAYEEINEATVDKVESALFDQIEDGNITAIIFYLKTKAKARGYVERQEVTGQDGNALKIEIEYLNHDDSEDYA